MHARSREFPQTDSNAESFIVSIQRGRPVKQSYEIRRAGLESSQIGGTEIRSFFKDPIGKW